jgi:UDP-N-acetylglucosamine--N-acetylmuramyl-(pentapeptide) pyrophosphoryl-undecaprenol N-acetylglucosamine transferase
MVFAIGGSQGSQTINDQILKIAPDFADKAEFVLVAGEKNFPVIASEAKQSSNELLTTGSRRLKPRDDMVDNNLTVLPFVSEAEMCKYMKKAEIVITRAGATTMAEIAAVGAPSIIIPSPYLASDHQTKNAEIFDGNEAAFVVYEKDLASGELGEKISRLLGDEKLRQQFSKNIRRFGKPNAAKRMAETIIEVGNEQAKK